MTAITLTITDPDRRTMLHQMCSGLVYIGRKELAERLWNEGQKARDLTELTALLPDDVKLEVRYSDA